MNALSIAKVTIMMCCYGMLNTIFPLPFIRYVFIPMLSLMMGVRKVWVLTFLADLPKVWPAYLFFLNIHVAQYVALDLDFTLTATQMAVIDSLFMVCSLCFLVGMDFFMVVLIAKVGVRFLPKYLKQLSLWGVQLR